MAVKQFYVCVSLIMNERLDMFACMIEKRDVHVCDVDITTDMTVWDGVVVTPSDKAYETKEEEEKEAGNEEKMDVQEK